MEEIYVFGHQKPDTDSVCSSISMSYLKNQLGLNTVPKVLGHINQESKYVLDYFKIPEPKYLNDVKVQVRNMKYSHGLMINEQASIKDTFNLMQEHKVTGMPIVDKNKKLSGLVTLKEIARAFINGNKETLDTNMDNIVATLDGEVVLKYTDEIKGRILVGSYQSKTFEDEKTITSDDILIVGDRYKVLNYAIQNKVKLLIVVGNYDLDAELLELAKQNQINIIKTKMDTYHASSNILLSNYIAHIMDNRNPITILDTDYRTDFLDLCAKNGHTNYPVINKDNKCLGLIRLNDANQYNKLKVILVDHNGFGQSVEGIEEAKIEEVIDHHNLLNIGTPDPINFRSMPVGCTCTIIYHLFIESGVEIPSQIAGIMLSAILSDTLLLRSVTTTEEDKRVVAELAKIAGVDVATYGHEMVKAGFSIKGKKAEELLEEDIKTFKANNTTFGISQIFTMDYEDIKADMDNFIDKIDELATERFDMVITLITDIEKNGSYVFYDRKSEHIVKEIFNDDNFTEGSYIQDLLSRKKQLVPPAMEVLEKK